MSSVTKSDGDIGSLKVRIREAAESLIQAAEHVHEVAAGLERVGKLLQKDGREDRLTVKRMTIGPNDTILIPTRIAVCSFCGATISAQCERFDKDGLPTVDGLFLQCAAEPCPTTDDWDTWHQSHPSEKRWAKVRPAVLSWLRANYRGCADWETLTRTYTIP